VRVDVRACGVTRTVENALPLPDGLSFAGGAVAADGLATPLRICERAGAAGGTRTNRVRSRDVSGAHRQRVAHRRHDRTPGGSGSLVALTLALALVAGAVAVGWDPVLGVALILTGATSRGSS
jgi:hypothetical protein